MKPIALRIDCLEDRSMPSVALIEDVGNWIQSLQYDHASPYVDGAIRVHHTIGRSEDSTYMVDPYFANLAVVGLLRSPYSQKFAVATAWINWYFNNLNLNGTMDRHWYDINGNIPTNNPLTEADAEDSAASTFLMVVDAYIDAGFGAGFFNTDVRKYRLNQMGQILKALQQSDGLTWAKWTYPVKYTQDVSESYAGFMAMARIQRAVFGNESKAFEYEAAATATKDGILDKLYNETHSRFYWKTETSYLDGNDVFVPESNQLSMLADWYPNTTATIWPALFNVIPPDSTEAVSQYQRLNTTWNGTTKPDWTTTQLESPEAGYAALVHGDTAQANQQITAVIQKHFRSSTGTLLLPQYPFVSGEANWVLQALVPYVQPLELTTDEDTTVSRSLVGYDLQNDPLTYTITTLPSHGTLTQFNTNTGAFTYKPHDEYSGTDFFAVTVSDGAITSLPRNVPITIRPVNDAPSFVKGSSFTINEDAGTQVANGWATSINRGAANEAGQTLQFQVTTNNNGLFAELPNINPATGTLVFRTTPNATGNATVFVTLVDNGGTANGGSNQSVTQSFTINVLPINDPPTAATDNANVRDGGTVMINVLANDSDPEGQSLTLGQFTQPTFGRVIRLGNTFRYTANVNASGTDTFTYTVSDGQGGVSIGTVQIQVTDLTRPAIADVRLYYGTNFISLTTQKRVILPWSNIRRIDVTFTDDVSAGLSVNDLTLQNANGQMSNFNFQYDAERRTGTWTLPTAIPLGRSVLRIAGIISDSAGNKLASSWARTLHVLPGDVNGDGIVNAADVMMIDQQRLGSAPQSIWADIDGNGFINNSDRMLAQANYGKRLG